MKKNNKKGFILAETIAISVIVLGALIYIYTQFISINNSYYTSFKYNTVDNLYKVENMTNFIEIEGSTSLVEELQNSSDSYVDITDASSYFVEFEFWTTLLQVSHVKQVIFTYEDTSSLNNSLQNIPTFSEKMKTFIQRTSSKENTKYRILVEFENDEFATLKVDLSTL